MRTGLELLEDEVGAGPEVERLQYYQIKLRCWLNKGDAIKWKEPWGLADRAQLQENGEVLITDVRLDREYLINGLFYGMQGMKVGGKRKLRISPHLAYGEKGLTGEVPRSAVIVCEIEVLGQRNAP